MKKGSGSSAVACLLRPRSEDVRVYSKNFDRSFHWLWLRDHCKCSSCVDVSSGQKNRTSGSVMRLARSAPVAAHIQGKVLVVDFVDHSAQVPLSSLGVVTPASKREQMLLSGKLQDAVSEMQRGPNFQTRPSISYGELMNDSQGRAWVLRTVQSSGLVFVDEIPRQEGVVVSVTELAERLAPVMHTFYGHHWDVRNVAGADNVAYTAKQLGWHQDLLYFESPPGLQLLHCLEAAANGGETLFLDGVAAANAFEAEHPEDFLLLSKLHITYQYSNASVTLSQRRPVFAPATDLYSHRRVFWSPEWQGTLNLHRNVSRVYQALHLWDEFLDKQNVLAVKMQPGTAVIFDNQRFTSFVLFPSFFFKKQESKNVSCACELFGGK
jgi:gamma-butyrobetaine dioxygenase